MPRSSLWTNFYCMDRDKPPVYLERSRHPPIHLSLIRCGGFYLDDVVSNSSPTLLVGSSPWDRDRAVHFQHISDLLFCPTPLL